MNCPYATIIEHRQDGYTGLLKLSPGVTIYKY